MKLVAAKTLAKAKRRHLSTEERAAIWEAYNKRCPYTGDLIAFSELEIDHIVPITIAPDDLRVRF